MTYTFKKYDKSYRDIVKKISDDNLSSGFLSDYDLEHLDDDEHYCHMLVDESGKVVCINFGRYVNREAANEELRCSKEEFDELFPTEKTFILDDGLAVLPEYRGQGLGHRMFKESESILFSKADAKLAFSWVRHGEEEAITAVFNKRNGHFYKLIPEYWKDYTDLYCEYCHGRCHCSTAVFYFKKEDILK